MKITLLFALACITSLQLQAQLIFELPLEEAVELKVPSGVVKGTLVLPRSVTPLRVAVIIAGSGPTDRDGNNSMINIGEKKNNSLKMLADSLAQNGIASLRFDKRGIGESKAALKSESDIRFEDYVNDVASWISILKNDKRFSRVIVIGHSEGSLIGMLAAGRIGADAFISIAGVSEKADNVLRRQLMSASGGIADLAFPILDSLAAGKTVEKIPPTLMSVFRPSTQPYLISWFKYDPAQEIAKLSMPILILQGTTDIQVLVADATALSKANSGSKLAIIEGMNHVMKNADIDRAANFAAYTNPKLPLNAKLVRAIVEFLK